MINVGLTRSELSNKALQDICWVMYSDSSIIQPTKEHCLGVKAKGKVKEVTNKH